MKQPLILITGGTGAAANGTPTWNLNQNYAGQYRARGRSSDPCRQ